MFMADCDHLWAWKETQGMQGPFCYVLIKTKEKRPIAKIICFVREETQLKQQARTPFQNMPEKDIMDFLFLIALGFCFPLLPTSNWECFSHTRRE